jgi:hypothetical protein
MRADAMSPLSTIAVETQNLESCRVAHALQPAECRRTVPDFLAMLTAATVDVVDGKKLPLTLTAARTLSAVFRNCGVPKYVIVALVLCVYFGLVISVVDFATSGLLFSVVGGVLPLPDRLPISLAVLAALFVVRRQLRRIGSDNLPEAGGRAIFNVASATDERLVASQARVWDWFVFPALAPRRAIHSADSLGSERLSAAAAVERVHIADYSTTPNVFRSMSLGLR